MARDFQRVPRFLTMAGLVASWVILTATLATSPLFAASDSEERAPCEMTIEFATPTDWRCTTDERKCTVCRNSSDHGSDLFTRCVGAAAAAQRRQLPPGAEISICADSLQVSGAASGLLLT